MKGVIFVTIMILLLASFSYAFSLNQPWHPLHQVATGSYSSVDADNNSAIDTSDNCTGSSTCYMNSGYVSSDLNVDNGTFFVDASSNYIGIGTNSPDSQFEIYGDPSTLSLKTGDNMWGGNGGTISVSTYGDMTFHGGYCAGSCHDSTATLNFKNVTISGSNPGLLTLVGTLQEYIQWFPQLLTGGRKALMGYETPSGDDFSIHNEVSGANILLIADGDGKVGINEQSPSANLDVNGSIRVQGLTSCDTIDTDASGNFVCGTDAVGSVSDIWVDTTGDTMTGRLNIDMSAGSGSSGRDALEIITSSDNTLGTIICTDGGSGQCDGIQIWSSSTGQSGVIQAGKFKDGATYYLDPANTSTAANLAGTVNAAGFTESGSNTLSNSITGSSTDVSCTGCLGSTEITDNSLTASDLAAGSVGTSEVSDNSLTASDLAAGSVGTSEVSDNSLDFADFQNTLDIDSSTTINFGSTPSLIFNLAGTGDLKIQDAGTDQHIFYDNGDVRLGDNNELYIDTSADAVGMGTSTPAYDLDVVRNGPVQTRLYDTSGNWVAEMFFERGANSGSVTYGDASATDMYVANFDGPLRFLTYASERMVITTGGNVGIGVTDPGAYKLYVGGTIYTSGGCTGCSDIRWKKNITDIQNPLNKTLQLRGVNFNWRADEYPDMFFSNDTDIGLIAQEVEKVLPEVVYEVDGYKYIRYDKLAPLLIESVKVQQGDIENLTQEVTQLKQIVCIDHPEAEICN